MNTSFTYCAYGIGLRLTISSMLHKAGNFYVLVHLSFLDEKILCHMFGTRQLLDECMICVEQLPVLETVSLLM